MTDTKNMMENNIANQKKLKEDKDAEGFYKQKKQYERNVEVTYVMLLSHIPHPDFIVGSLSRYL